MTKIERIRAAIHGERPDRVPFSLWTHFPGIDMDPVRLADHSWEFAGRLEVDFLKTMSNGMYPIEDLGCVCDYSEVEQGGVARVVETPVREIADWDAVPLASCEQGALARELYMLELLVEKRTKSGVDLPIIFTVFSPITIADKLSGKRLLDHIAAGGEAAIHGALERIAQSTAELARRAVALGADGVFLASQMSNHDVMSEEDYRMFGVPYDKQVLEASQGWFNAIHAHGDAVMFDLLRDYPVQVFNWHVWESLPELEECRALSGKCLMGGLKRMDITNRDRSAVRNQIFRTVQATGGRGLILTPGCVIRYPLDEEMFAYVRQTKELVEQALLGR